MGLFSRIMMLFRIKTSAALDRVEDPRELVDYAYSQQQELLRRTKQGLIEVATAKTRLDRQAEKLRTQVPEIEQRAAKAIYMGREDLARIALRRKQTVLAELQELDLQIVQVGAEEEQLTRTERELAVKIEEFRTRRDSISARYTAAEAQVRVSEAMTGVSGEFADLSMALGRAMEKTDRMQARASAIGSLVESGRLALRGHVTDPVERELREAAVEGEVEDELEKLKRKQLGPGKEDREEM